jgi:hypothetical protein
MGGGIYRRSKCFLETSIFSSAENVAAMKVGVGQNAKLN